MALGLTRDVGFHCPSRVRSYVGAQWELPRAVERETGRGPFMHSSRPPRGGSSPAALPALLRASHLFGLALGSALGKLRDSGVTAARMFESALLLRMTRQAAEILGARWDKVPERHRPHYGPEHRLRRDPIFGTHVYTT